LHDAVADRQGVERRLLLLKGKLLQEEWAAQRAMRILSLQQAALLQLHSLGKEPASEGAEGREVAACSRALEEAVVAGREFVDGVEDGGVGEARPAAAARAAKRLRAPARALLADLLEVHRQLATRGEGADEVRACIMALLDAGILAPEHSGANPRSTPMGAGTRPGTSASLASEASGAVQGQHRWPWQAVEERCERKATRAALRKCSQQMAAFGARCATELKLLEVECRAAGLARASASALALAPAPAPALAPAAADVG